MLFHSSFLQSKMRGVTSGRNRTYSTKRVLRSCRAKANFDNVEIIDLVGDEPDDLVPFKYVPEIVQPQPQGSRIHEEIRRFPSQSVISIDDDDGNDGDQPAGNVESGDDLDSAATSSQNLPTFTNTRSFLNVDCDDKESTFKFVRSNKCQAQEAQCSNRFGLDSDSKNVSSDTDSSDCEILEESARNVESGDDLDSDATSSHNRPMFTNTRSFLNVDCDDKESIFKFVRSNKSHAQEAQCSNRFGLDSDSKNVSSDTDSSDCEILEGSARKLRKQWERAALRRKGKSRNCQSSSDGQASTSVSPGDMHPNVGVCNMYERKAEEPPCTSSNGTCLAENLFPTFLHTVDNGSPGTSFENDFFPTSPPTVDNDYPGARMQSYNVKFDQKIDQDLYPKGRTRVNTNFSSSKHPISDHTEAAHQVYSEKTAEKQSISNSHESPDVHFNNVGATQQVPVISSFEEHRCDESSNINHECNELEEARDFSLEPSSCNGQQRGIIFPLGKPKENKNPYVNSASTNKLRYESDLSHIEVGGIMLAVRVDDIINEREKLKETDDYKRAVAEEWAARHRQLQIQAEEAHRLRKRKKAENMRLLDMQQRQKLRIQEVRETQKKDEDIMNEKETIRAEVRNQLCKLETTCFDMASLLRGLGIHVQGNFQPLSSDVRAAYKRAVLKFHPDRASRIDIHGQVEAEEKFKLISRMKEKLLFT